MVMRVGLVVCALLAFGLSGCAASGGLPIAADVAGQGQWSAGVRENVTFPCDGTARFDAGAQGQGHLVIRVKDAAGATLASLTLNGQSQQGIDREVEGQPGQWNLRVEVKNWDMGSYGGFGGSGVDFQGQYGAVVFCDEPN